MAPKKGNKSKINENNIKSNKRSKTLKKSDNNNGINAVIHEKTGHLRRSTRVSSKTINSSKSQYFEDSDESHETDDSLGNDKEFKPEVKSKQSIVKPIKRKGVSEVDSISSSDEDSEEWEEVEDNVLEDELKEYNPIIPSEGVEISLNESELKNKKKKKCLDINDLIRQRVNRFKRELQTYKHKTSLLLLISRAFYLNNSLNDELIQSMALSVMTLKAPKRLSIQFLNQLIDWFHKNFEFKYSKRQTNETIIESIVRSFEERIARNSTQLNLTFLSLIRILNKKILSRLCYALKPVDLKPNDLILSEKQLETKRKSLDNKSSNKSKLTSNTEKKVKKSKNKKRKIVSSDSESETETKDSVNQLEIWIELYIDRKWICLDLSNNIVDKPTEIAAKSLPQLSYVIGLDSDGYIREVTQRYSNDWMSNAMKGRRTDQKWWTQTLQLFQREIKSAAEKAEDLEFETKTSSTPLPLKMSEYKNHPLYVLTKDLLKFQGIYPSDAPPLGFFRDQPVYARECVQLLRSRETWLRFARSVRVGETAYKVVKSRPKWDKYVKEWKRDLPLDLFGEWQTDPYDPPQAKDGKVPRNGYGNIDLFQSCMLPKGCVHLQLSGLLRIANKLGIDCAPAIVAFDNNNGGLGSHPVSDGFVVCEEFKEVLIAAWDEEQENIRKRENEKKEKRVLDNWKKLIKGLIIREKVKKKYENSVEESEETDIESDY